MSEYQIIEQGQASFTHTYMIKANSPQEAYEIYNGNDCPPCKDWSYDPDKVDAVEIHSDKQEVYIPEEYRP